MQVGVSDLRAVDQLTQQFRRSQTNPKPWTVTIFVSHDDPTEDTGWKVDWKEVQRVYADDQLGAYTIAMLNVCDRMPMTAQDELSIVCQPANPPSPSSSEDTNGQAN